MIGSWRIDYQRIMKRLKGKSPRAKAEQFLDAVEQIWVSRYTGRSNRRSTPHWIDLEPGFTYVFDCTPEERLVVVYGFSGKPLGKRDAPRMQGFLGGSIKDVYPGCDKGHFIAHAMGGGLDINLFPQARTVNRGWCQQGYLYRSMERYCTANSGTFVFSRPIYGDESWKPHYLEYGVIRSDGSLWIGEFGN